MEKRVYGSADRDERMSDVREPKFAARLQHASTGGPVLLRVDFDAGHGLGSTRQQTDAQWADVLAFVLAQGRT
jgi:prolyl oligopeptidase